MKRRRTAKIVLGVTSGVLLTRVLLSFCAIGLFFHFFYARYDTLCPTDLRTSDLTAPTVPVTFDANGAALSGLRIGDGQKGVIVMIHGMRSGMDAHFAEADYFAAHGYTVFTFDGTGTRTSSGDSRCSVSFARDDLDAALDYLETTDLGSLPVFLYGHSSGGYAAATVLERADAAALLCAFDDPIDTMCDTASQYTGILVELQRPYLMLWNRIKAGSDANECASVCINRTDTPVLIVGASDDTVIPADDALYLHPDRITDPNVAYLLREGGHSEVWLSADALIYRAEMPPDIPETLDRLRYNAVDPEFLDAVLTFFESAK